MILNQFADLVKDLQATTGRKEKEAILSQYKDNFEIKLILRYTYDPYIILGLSKKSLTKQVPVEADNVPSDIIELLTYLAEHNTGRYVDIAHAQAFIRANEDYKDLILDIISKELRTGVQPTTLNKIFGEGFIRSFGVQLAQRYFENPEKFLPKGTTFILSQKLDGIRCVITKDYNGRIEFFTRQGQPIEGLVELKEEAKYLSSGYVYDGELLLDKDVKESKDLYRETVKVVNSDGEKRGIIFNCFDSVAYVDYVKGFDERPTYLRKDFVHKLLQSPNFHYIKEVPNLYMGMDQTEITRWLDKITSEGGEGVMINIADAPYECKRSKFLLKVKKFNTADVKVLSLEEGTGANKGRLGAVQVEFLGPDGKPYTCKVGSGFEQSEREYFWKNPEELQGEIIEIKYFEISNNQENDEYSLRFPTFKSVRFDKSEISMY